MIKIKLKQKNNKDGIIRKILLNSGIIELVMSLEFTKKNMFKKKKLKKLIYMRNVDDTFNHKGLIEHIVEVELFYKEKNSDRCDRRAEMKYNIEDVIVSTS